MRSVLRHPGAIVSNIIGLGINYLLSMVHVLITTILTTRVTTLRARMKQVMERLAMNKNPDNHNDIQAHKAREIELEQTGCLTKREDAYKLHTRRNHQEIKTHLSTKEACSIEASRSKPPKFEYCYLKGTKKIANDPKNANKLTKCLQPNRKKTNLTGEHRERHQQKPGPEMEQERSV